MICRWDEDLVEFQGCHVWPKRFSPKAPLASSLGASGLRPAPASRSVKAAPWTRSCRGGSSNLNSSFEAPNSHPPQDSSTNHDPIVHHEYPEEDRTHHTWPSARPGFTTKLAMDHRPQAWGRVCHPHHGALCRPPMNPIRTRSLTLIDPPHSPETISTAPMTAPTSTTAGPSRPRSRPS